MKKATSQESRSLRVAQVRLRSKDTASHKASSNLEDIRLI